MSVLLAELPFRRAGAAADEVLRLASQDYNHPSAPGFYQGALQRDGDSALAPLHTRTAMSHGEMFGGAKIAAARLPVANTGWLDWLISGEIAVEGRPFARLLLGADGDTAYKDFTPVLTGQVAALEISRSSLNFILRDPMAVLDLPLTGTSYAGTNRPPDGVEGGEADLKGKNKPVAYGEVRDAPAIAVNIPKHIYQIADRPLAIQAVYDKGKALAAGARQASLQALLETNPRAGTFDCYAGQEGSFFRLGFAAAGAVTADLREGGMQVSAGQVWQRLLTERCGIDASTLRAGDLAALDAVAPGAIGLWSGLEGMTRREALDRVAASVGAIYWVTPTGEWRIARWAAPLGDAALTLRAGGALARGESDLISLESAPWPLPAYELKFFWGRCWTPLTGGALAAAVLETEPGRRAFLSQEWRTESLIDAAVKHDCPMARSLQFQSLLVQKTDAEAEAARRFALLKTRLRAWRAACIASPEHFAAVDLMSTIALHHPRFGLEGQKFQVIEAAGDRATGRLTLVVLG